MKGGWAICAQRWSERAVFSPGLGGGHSPYPNFQVRKLSCRGVSELPGVTQLVSGGVEFECK